MINTLMNDLHAIIILPYINSQNKTVHAYFNLHTVNWIQCFWVPYYSQMITISFKRSCHQIPTKQDYSNVNPGTNSLRVWYTNFISQYLVLDLNNNITLTKQNTDKWSLMLARQSAVIFMSKIGFHTDVSPFTS